MTYDLILRGGKVLTDSGVEIIDVAIVDGRIAAMGRSLGEAELVVECVGSWIGPGFVDVHTHLREPGQEWKEDIASGTSAAAVGGYTALIAMPNTDPAIDTPKLARQVNATATEAGHAEVASAGCLTIGRKGHVLAPINELWEAGVRVFSDDGDVVADALLLRTAMERIVALGGVISQHAVDADLSSVGSMHEGAVSSRLGLVGIPREADDIIIARDIALVRLTGVRYHVQHISTAGGVGLIAGAKREGLPVTAEVTPHHLMFNDEDLLTLDTSLKMMPPLREKSDQAALIDGLRSGVIDVVGTDHAPHASVEKDVEFADAMNGVIGLEWAASVVNTVVQLDQATFFDRMSIAPARIAGFADHGLPLRVGNRANIVVFDPVEPWTPTATLSKSANSPYLGRAMSGRVKMTVLNGLVTHGGDR
ncbi:MAG: dihydroorotase [Actinomycetota bacterium]